ncbi:Plasmodium variant antigen protein Cir/Yir/Bir, putative [Plasmodium chabaudi adami]|uniref:Plasmodium variant antigen protein Cir/Yir/Bir, putative n=1 Tax=Plasmodium chabaudi adami TaxID=5826 RepID=A0A1D3LCI4_PLACE|nr:Plasmodium variant antigen protein Cir/Yir/Bir, putative [Plasmodium chabaudi adami]
MDNHEMLCGLLIEADGYFNGKDVDTTKINEQTTIKSYCRNGDCKTNEAGINALAAYIFKLFKDSIKSDEYNEYNDYDEYLLMWLSDKLLKIHKKGKGKNIGIGRMDGTTLNQAYDIYLEKHKGIFDYWDILNMQQENVFYLNLLKCYTKLYNEAISNIIKSGDISHMIKMVRTNHKIRMLTSTAKKVNISFISLYYFKINIIIENNTNIAFNY